MKEHIMEPRETYTLCGRYRCSGIYYQVHTWREFDRDHIEAVRANRDSTNWRLRCVDAVERRIAAEEGRKTVLTASTGRIPPDPFSHPGEEFPCRRGARWKQPQRTSLRRYDLGAAYADEQNPRKDRLTFARGGDNTTYRERVTASRPLPGRFDAQERHTPHSARVGRCLLLRVHRRQRGHRAVPARRRRSIRRRRGRRGGRRAMGGSYKILEDLRGLHRSPRALFVLR